MTRTRTETDTATVPENAIVCEVCQSQYEKRLGSSNDCPNCNAPGGKGPDSAMNSEALKGMSGAVQGAFETAVRNINLQSKRIADLEARVTTLENK